MIQIDKHTESNKYRDVNIAIGKRIRQLRKMRRLSTSEAADFVLQIANKTWNDIERGKRPPTTQQVIEIARYFEVSTDSILTGNKPEYAEIESTTGLNEEAIDNLQSGFNGNENQFYTTLCNRFLSDSDFINYLCEYAIRVMVYGREESEGGINLLRDTAEYEAHRAFDSFFEKFCADLATAEAKGERE